MNAWLTLIVAGLFEMGWPLGFKLAQLFPQHKMLAILFSVVSMAVSGWLLFLAQKTIPMGTAYCVWTGMGGAGTFLLGVMFFGDPLYFWRVLAVAMIIGGVILLKMT